MANIKGVEIFGVGTWRTISGMFKFVPEDLSEIVENTRNLHKKRGFKPRLKFGHSTNQILKGQDDGDPALGFLSNFSISEDKILANFIDLPDIVFELIDKKRFTSVSVELDHIPDFGWYIKAAALLGADLPSVKTLQDLQVFLSDTNATVHENALCFSEPAINKKKEVVSMTPEEKAEMDKLKADNARLTGDLKTSNADTAKFKEEKRVVLFSEKKTELLKPFSEQVKAGKLTPANFAKLEASLDAQVANFSESSELQVPVNIVTELMSDESRVNFSETGTVKGDGDSGVTPDVALDQAIQKIMGTSQKTYAEASDIVTVTEPKLFKAYAKWTDDISYGRV